MKETGILFLFYGISRQRRRRTERQETEGRKNHLVYLFRIKKRWTRQNKIHQKPDTAFQSLFFLKKMGANKGSLKYVKWQIMGRALISHSHFTLSKRLLDTWIYFNNGIMEREEANVNVNRGWLAGGGNGTGRFDLAIGKVNGSAFALIYCHRICSRHCIWGSVDAGFEPFKKKE